MILKPRNLREMDQMLREVPAKKRKVIVLVGRHPNEGTINIAQRHHGDWEKHGAVVVRIPGKWTPHYVWQKASKGKESMAALDKGAETPTDIDIAKFLLRRRFKVPIVNFHASPGDSPESHRPKGLLDYYLSIRSRIHEHPLFFCRFTRPKYKTNMLVVEFFYRGKSIVNKRLSSFAQKYSNLVTKPGMQPGYLGDPRITREALSLFSAEGAPEFEEVLAHLAKTQLKRHAVRPKLF